VYTETEIIKGCKQNSAPHQRMLYTRHAPMLKSVCLRYIKDRDEAKDVLQDSFIKIFNSIGKYKGEGSIEGWLKRIVINVSLDYLKKNQRIQFEQKVDWEIHEKMEDEDALSNADVLLNAGFTTDDLLEVLHSIHTEFASVFNLFYIDGLSHKEIAEVLKIAEDTSRTRLYRAKMLFRKELEKEMVKRKLTY
jgi:RNA polymerase sigma-70 factor, ECF subfamily